MIIFVVMILLMVGLATATSLQLAGTGVADSSMAEREQRAFYLAESAVERQRSMFNNGAACNQLAPDPDPATTGMDFYTFEGGTIAVTSFDDTNLPHCFITVEARIGDVVRRIRVDLLIEQGQGLYEPFPSDEDFQEHWQVEIIDTPGGGGWWSGGGGTDGYHRWDAENCPLADCPNTTPNTGSFLIGTSNGGVYSGYAFRPIRTITTGPNGLDFLFGIGFEKTRARSWRAENVVKVAFYDSATDTETIVWEDTNRGTNGWTYEENTVSLLPDKNYDEVRLIFNLRGRLRGGGGRWGGTTEDMEVKFDDFRVPNLWGGQGASLFGWEEI